MITTLNRFSSIDRLFDHVFNDVMGAPINSLAAPTLVAPALDIRTSEEDLYLSIDVPGLKQEDLELTLENGVLSVKAQSKHNPGPEGHGWDSRRYRSLSVSYQLPEYVDTERLTANLADGVLTVRAPKHERAKPKKVPIAIGASDTIPKQLNETSK